MNGAVRFIWSNRKFDAATLTASSAATNFPVTALQDPARARTWRTTGVINEWLAVDFGEPIYCTCLVLVDHNFTENGRLRVQASDMADFSVLLKDDDPYTACEDRIGAGEGGAGEHGAGGVILYEELDFYAPKTLKIEYFEPPSGQDHIRARYWRVLIIDPDNPTGYFEIGRLFLCTYDDYAYQFSYGWGYGWQDESVITRSTGGQDWVDSRPVRRTLRLPWSLLPEEDRYWRLQFFIERVGIKQDFVVDAFPAGRPSKRFYNALLAKLSEMPEVVQVSLDLSQVELKIVESL